MQPALWRVHKPKWMLPAVCTVDANRMWTSDASSLHPITHPTTCQPALSPAKLPYWTHPQDLCTPHRGHSVPYALHTWLMVSTGGLSTGSVVSNGSPMHLPEAQPHPLGPVHWHKAGCIHQGSCALSVGPVTSPGPCEICMRMVIPTTGPVQSARNCCRINTPSK